MAACLRLKTLVAAWLLVFGMVTSDVDARSASRNLKYFLNRRHVDGGGLRSNKMRSLREQKHRALPANPERKVQPIISLLESDRGGQNRLLPGFSYPGHSTSSSKSSKGKSSTSKSSKSSKGKGKGKGGSSKCKSKGKGKGGKGKDDSCDEGGPDIPDFCDQLDFRGGVGELPPPEVYGDYGSPHKYKYVKSGKKHRGLMAREQQSHRELQFDGPLCDTNVIDTAKNIPTISIFVSLIEQAGLEDIFLCAGPFTVLAPSNAAFAGNPGLTDYLADLDNVEVLREVLLYDIIPGLYLLDDFQFGELETLQGEDIIVNLAPLTFNGAGVGEGDILACNGVIDVIDEVIVPPGFNILPEVCDSLDFGGETEGALCEPNALDTARRSRDLTTFVQLVELAGLSDVFLCAGPFTLLAPSNAAFDELDPEVVQELLLPENIEKLQDLLLYHIAPGFFPPDELQAGSLETLLVDQTVEVTLDPIMFNQRAGVVQDAIACNGALYTIDDVLVPETNLCDMFDYGGDAPLNCMPSVTEIAAQYPELTLATALLERAELTEIFTCPGPFTMLLPSNSAFDAVDPVFLEFLLRPENQEALEDLLLYHIISGNFPTNDLTSGTLETLLPGEVVAVEILPLTFNGASVLVPDIEACNGLVDIIDSVLLPFEPPTAAPVPVPTPDRVVPSPVPQPTEFPTIAPAPVLTMAPTSFCNMFDFEDPESGEEGCTPNVLEQARTDPELSLAVILFERAELTEIFTCPGAFTALIPTNAAIENVDAALIEFLLQPENRRELQNLMLYHILPGYYPSSGLVNGPIETLFVNRDVEVTVSSDSIMFNEATVLDADIEACNGLIYTLNEVLTFLPPRPTSSPTNTPTRSPTAAPTPNPTVSPVMGIPETLGPSTAAPIPAPGSPTISPVTSAPSASPTGAPTAAPTLNPTPTPGSPTASPVTELPTEPPTAVPTASPVTAAPTEAPTTNPTPTPGSPTASPVTAEPSTSAPSSVPTILILSDTPTASPGPTLGMASSAPSGMGTVSPAPTPGINVTVSPAPTPAGNETVSPAPTPAGNETVSPAPDSSGDETVSPAPTMGGNETVSPAPTPMGNETVSPAPTMGGNETVSPAPSMAGGNETTSPAPSMAGGNETTSPAPSMAGGNETTSPTPSMAGGNETISPAPSMAGGNETISPAPAQPEIAVPTVSPAPTETPVLRVRVNDFFLAYVSNSNPLVEPTPEQYAEQADLTNKYFEQYFGNLFENETDVDFLGTELVLDFTLFEAGNPNPRFNIYMDYANLDLIYTEDSSPPDPAATFSLLRDSMTADFIRDYVWNVTDSAFSTVNEVVLRASTTENPNPEERVGIQERNGSKESLPVGAVAAAGGAALIIMAAAVVLFRRTRSPTEYMDGIYALDNKAVEGYFGEHSVTEEASENASRFPPIHMVEDDGYDDGGSSEHQPLREQA